MKVLGEITDPSFTKRDYTKFERTLLSVTKDERDLPFTKLLTKISITLLPMAVSLYFISGWIWWVVALTFLFFNIFKMKGSHGLMLHCISHRPLFKAKYSFLWYYVNWIINPLFGHTPETYFSHHMGMHHPENNMPEDGSCTMGYQRDNWKHFLLYLAHFLVLGFADMFKYLTRKRRYKLAYTAMIGELSFYTACVFLAFINLHATIVALIIPFISARMIMMVGNWTQHSFVDPEEPDNVYKSSITCINIKYNHKCWNDGYHTSHHARPALHWTDHPKNFLSNLDKYAANKSVVFDRMDFLAVFSCLMTKNYKKLAANFVNINNTFESDEEIIALLKRRTVQFDVSEIENPVILHPIPALAE